MEVSKIAAALKAVNDVGTKLLSDCMAASDGTVDAEPLRNACADLFTAIAPASDSAGKTRKGAKDDGTALEDRFNPGGTEVATGDKRASDSRLAYDNYGRRVPARVVSTTHTVQGIFGGSKHDDGHPASEASIGSIFNSRHV